MEDRCGGFLFLSLPDPLGPSLPEDGSLLSPRAHPRVWMNPPLSLRTPPSSTPFRDPAVPPLIPCKPNCSLPSRPTCSALLTPSETFQIYPSTTLTYLPSLKNPFPQTPKPPAPRSSPILTRSTPGEPRCPTPTRSLTAGGPHPIAPL